jgi:hypothetical protein
MVADVDAAIFTLDLAVENGREASPAIVGQTAETDLIEAVTASALPLERRSRPAASAP